ARGRARAFGLWYLNPESMEAGRGWADALSATIGDLESAGLTADYLDAAARDGDGKLAARLADLAALWRTADDSVSARAPDVRSAAGLLLGAAGSLDADGDLRRSFGTVLAVLGLWPTTAELRLVAALRPAGVALLVGRPERAPVIERTERVREALGANRTEWEPQPTPGPGGEISLIHEFLFA